MALFSATSLVLTKVWAPPSPTVDRRNEPAQGGVRTYEAQIGPGGSKMKSACTSAPDRTASGVAARASVAPGQYVGKQRSQGAQERRILSSFCPGVAYAATLRVLRFARAGEFTNGEVPGRVFGHQYFFITGRGGSGAALP